MGHFNHRYFFSFCVYMTLGCVYCSVSSKDLFLDAYGSIEVTRDQKKIYYLTLTSQTASSVA